MRNLIETTLKEKISNDSDYIRYSYYELKVKYNLSEQDIDRFLDLTRTKLQNDNYRVYFTGSKFVYKNQGNASREFFVNGCELTGEFDSLMDINRVFIPTADITDGMVIEVID